MHLYATHDRPLIDRRRNGVESVLGLMLLPLGADLRFLVRQAVAGGNSVVRRWVGVPGTRIHVSPMSPTWLRIHEADYNKHAAEI
jgi:hypothetical protein